MMNVRSQHAESDTTPTRLLDAVERIYAEQSPSAATMRAIATEAGCSLGIAYRYFNSKDELLGAALDRMSERIAAASTGSDDPAEALTRLWQALGTHPAFPRLVNELVAEGKDVPSVMSGHPLIRDVTNSARARGNADPPTIAGIMALLAVAGSFYGPMINRALDRDPDDQTLYDSTAHMFKAWTEHQNRQNT
jgi:AcrR family transcriptional regulator